MGTLFFQNLPIDYAGGAVPRFRNSACFIDIPAIALSPLCFIRHTEFNEAEIKGKKLILIMLLKMVTERIPPVLLQPGDDAGADRYLNRSSLAT